MNELKDKLLEALFEEKTWPNTVLQQLRYLHTTDRRLLSVDLQNPDTMLPFDPEAWYGILLNYGYIAVGSCPNGDFIAVDCENDIGNVCYISHEEFHYDPASTEDISAITRPVASSIQEYITGLKSGTVPLDYFD